MTIKVYYWNMLARGAAPLRILEHTETPYEYISEMPKFGAVMSKFGANTDCFAPPVVEDGDYIISQSTAATMYLGKKLGLTPPGYDDFKTMQHMADIVDLFEGNLGKNNEHGPTLKKFLEGDRFKQLMTNLESGIKGPYYYGDQPCAADFFLGAHMDWRMANVFDPLNAKYGVEPLAPYKKIVGLHDALKATDGYKRFAAKEEKEKPKAMGPIKDDVLNAYND